jgi:hypothetical protein
MFLLLLFLLILLMVSCSLGSFRTLPESMFKFPMMTTTVLCPLFQVSRELFSILELLDCGVPSGFEAGEEGSVFGVMAVLGPEFVVGGWTSVWARVLEKRMEWMMKVETQGRTESLVSKLLKSILAWSDESHDYDLLDR